VDLAYKGLGTRTVSKIIRAGSTAPSTLLPGCCNQLLLVLLDGERTREREREKEKEREGVRERGRERERDVYKYR
jgi:hypothetical protein